MPVGFAASVCGDISSSRKALIALAMAAAAFAFQAAFAARTGQTLGRRIVGIRIDRDTAAAVGTIIRSRPRSRLESVVWPALVLLVALGFLVTAVETFSARALSEHRRKVAAAQSVLDSLDDLQQKHFDAYGRYSDDLPGLSRLSQEPIKLQSRILGALDDVVLELSASHKGYRISARAKDAQGSRIYSLGGDWEPSAVGSARRGTVNRR